MKSKFSLLIAAIFILGFSFSADAAFIVRKHSAITVSAPYTAPFTSGASAKETRLQRVQTLINNLHDDDNHTEKGKKKTGWQGIVALCCGVFGILFPPSFVVAVVYGAIGIGDNHKHKGMALAGLILGLIGSLLWGLALAMSVA